jgi:hypothetical protein
VSRQPFYDPVDPEGPVVGGGSYPAPPIVKPPSVNPRVPAIDGTGPVGGEYTPGGGDYSPGGGTKIILTPLPTLPKQQPKPPDTLPPGDPTPPGYDPYGEGDTKPGPGKKTQTKPYVPPPSKFGGSGMLGTARSVGDNINALQLISQFWGGSVESGKAIIRRFMGIFTKPGRDHAPLGALEDVRNLEPNVKTGALTQRKGSSAYASTFVSVGASATLTQLDDFFPLSTEIPSASDVDVVFGQTSGNVKHVLQKPFWQNGAKVDSYVNLNEVRTGVDSIVGAPSFPSTFITTSGLGAQYLKDWYCFITNRDAIHSGPYLVTSYTSATGEVTVSPQLDDRIVETDSVHFYRFPLFDINTSLPVQYSTVAGKPPVCLQQGQAFILSGGQSSAKSHRGLWSGYVSRTWLNGATNKPTGLATARTEVSWMDLPLKTMLGPLTALEPLTVGSLAQHTPTSTDLNLSAGMWFAGIVPQADDGLVGLPVMASTSCLVPTDGNGLTFSLTFRLPTFNKRIRYLHILLGKAPNSSDTSIEWDHLYVVKTLDLEDGTDWTFTETDNAPATPVLGFYSTEVVLDITDWNSAGEQTNLPLFMGSKEPSGTELSFSIGKFHTNRLFIAKYHDFSDGVDYNDHIRFSGVSGDGVGQVNFLSDAHLDGTSVTTVDLGDATAIQGLEKREEKLFIVKDSSCYYIPITEQEPRTWAIVTVSSYIGCTAPKTLVNTPYGIMWCQPGDDVYLWDGGSPVSMTQDTWRDTFKALTYADNWTAWFSTARKCFNFFDSVTGFWYSMYFEVPIAEGIYSWYRHNIPNTNTSEANHYFDSIVKFTSTREGIEYYIYKYVDGIMTEGDPGTTHYRIAYINSSATSDVDAEGIIPYLKTAPFRIDEVMITQVHHWYLASDSAGVGEFLPLCVLKIGTNSQSYLITSTAVLPSLLRRGVLQGTDRGRTVQLIFNDLLAATFTSLDIHQIGFEYELKPFTGDKTITS